MSSLAALGAACGDVPEAEYDAESSLSCPGGRCVTRCRADAQCPSAEPWCVFGVCVTGTVETKTYTPSQAKITNPDRGFIKWLEIHSSRSRSYTASDLRSYERELGTRLVFTYFTMPDFYGRDSSGRLKRISSSYLNRVRRHFDAVRQANFKIIPRFNYTRSLPSDRDPDPDDRPHFRDAIEDQVIQHIGQLASILRSNADIIYTMQAGFIGTWGEWAFSDEFGWAANADAIRGRYSPDNLVDRRRVLNALLVTLPNNSISVREPIYKAEFLKRRMPAGAVRRANAHRGDHASRIGFHIDCFLKNEEYSTFYFRPNEHWRYYRLETPYVVVGGETCQDTPSLTKCGSALDRLEGENWTYLNSSFSADVLQRWRRERCYDEIDRRLGYRLSLKRAEMLNRMRASDPLTVQLTLENTGFAAPLAKRRVYLVLRSTRGHVRKYDLGEDPRFWLPGDIDIRKSVGRLPPGVYDVSLHIADDASRLRNNPAYSVRLANDGMWESSTGYNRLGITVRVANSVVR